MDICILGLPKSGKTSILKVIFERAGPQITMMLDPTTKVEKTTKNLSFFTINIYDFPGKYDFKDATPEDIQNIQKCGSVIYVLDVQDDNINEPIGYLIECMKHLNTINPQIVYNIFLHKTDVEAFAIEEKKSEFLQNVKSSVRQELEYASLPNIQLDYHLTTIYDHSLIDCFSKVLQKIIPHVSHIVTLLDSLMINCKMQKVFLFEMKSKAYLASDSAPVEPQNYAICADMIDVVIDISLIYGAQKNKDERSQSIIKLNDSTLLYYKEIERFLALICIIKEQDFDRPFLIDYNIEIFRKGLSEIFKATQSSTK